MLLVWETFFARFYGVIQLPYEMSVSLRRGDFVRRHAVKCINPHPGMVSALYLYFVFTDALPRHSTRRRIHLITGKVKKVYW